MTKDIRQIQEENRRYILEAIHGCNYEEALQRESISTGGQLIWNKEKYTVIGGSPSPYSIVAVNDLYRWIRKDFTKDFIYDLNAKYLLGKPITLSRVLLALESQEIGFLDGYLFELEDKGYNGMVERWICKWDLTKETLEEQEESTQLAVNELLTT